MKIMFLDIETTGFDRRWDYIIEVAAILYDTEKDEDIDLFHEYIKPGKSIPEYITEITHISNYQVKNCRSEDEVLRDFFEFLIISEPDVLIAHNGDNFDIPFLRAKALYYFITMKKYDTIDTLKMARKLKPAVRARTKKGRPSYKQVALAEFYGIEYTAHSAIEDTKALKKIYFAMKDGTKDSISKERKKLGF